MGDYKNIALLSASTGIHKNTIGSRITKGMSKDEAISFKPRTYTKGIQLAADLAGVSKHNVMARIAEGKTLSEALANPFNENMLDKTKIKHLVEVEKLSLYSVAYVVGCSRTYLATYCKNHKIEKAFPNPDPFFIFHNGEMYSQRQICKVMGWKQNTFSAYWSRRKNKMTAQECFEQYKNKRGLI